jgi:hypothetical protein
MLRFRVALAVAFAGCGHKPNAQQCASDANDLQQLLQQAMRDGSPPIADTTTALVDRPELPPLGAESSSVVALGHDVRVFSSPMTGDELAKHLEWVHARKQRLVLAIDASATWDLVVRTITAATSAGLDHISFAFARSGHPPVPPPRSPVDDELDTIMKAPDLADRASKLAHLLVDTAKGCPSIGKVFSAAATEDSADRSNDLVAAIGPAIVECDCNVDIPALRSLMWRTLVDEHPKSVLTTAVSPDGTAIELAGSTPWREASKLFTASTTKLSPRVTP